MGGTMSADELDKEIQKEIDELREAGYSDEEIRALLSEDLWAGGVVS